MRNLRQILTKRVQSVGWVYLTNNFIIASAIDFRITQPEIPCIFVPISQDNAIRVLEFREESRVSEYKSKLARHEIGYFAECNGKMVGSIWATVNNARVPVVVRAYMRLLPGEALVHDIVASVKSRGSGIGPFLVSRMASMLLNDYRTNKIVIDVNFRNRPSLRMMDKVGLHAKQQVLYISAFGRLLFEKVLRQYPHF